MGIDKSESLDNNEEVDLIQNTYQKIGEREEDSDSPEYCSVGGLAHELGMPLQPPSDAYTKAVYDKGFIDGLKCFAHFKDGVQYVGTCGTTLQNAIDRMESLNGYNLS